MAYQFHKTKGSYTARASITNTDTGAVAILGNMTPRIAEILATHDYGTASDNFHTYYDYTYDISEDCANELLGLMTISKKPIRTKPKQTQQSEQEENPNDEIDMMDVLLGRAKYA